MGGLGHAKLHKITLNKILFKSNNLKINTEQEHFQMTMVKRDKDGYGRVILNDAIVRKSKPNNNRSYF